MVLKKIEAAGDMTATEITTACRKPSVPRRSAGADVSSAGVGAERSLTKNLFLRCTHHMSCLTYDLLTIDGDCSHPAQKRWHSSFARKRSWCRVKQGRWRRIIGAGSH